MVRGMVREMVNDGRSERGVVNGSKTSRGDWYEDKRWLKTFSK